MAYKRFEDEDIVLSSELVSTPIWSNGISELKHEEMVTSSIQLSELSGQYYWDIYYNGASGSTSCQFSITYANVNGVSGSEFPHTSDEDKSIVTYGQFRTLILGDEESDFKLDGSNPSEDFFAISIDRARFKERLMTGTLELNIKVSESQSLTLIDDSKISYTTRYIDSGRVLNLIQKGIDNSPKYGWLLPDIGVILVDYKQVYGTESKPVTVSDKLSKFYDSIRSITLHASETVTSNFIFVRARNSEFNYSINPSNIGSSGELKHDIMINSPQTFITTVGLYNDSGDLLAVAKLSRPLLKDFTKEALIRVKLDY